MEKNEIKDSMKVMLEPYSEEYTLIKISSSMVDEFEYSLLSDNESIDIAAYIQAIVDDAGYALTKEMYGRKEALRIWMNS